ncbi:MAG TPA: VanZ family protein [Micromonosporaceae bacterium]|nr:VanZ family protein [Micromonosporaceae bacterium]
MRLPPLLFALAVLGVLVVPPLAVAAAYALVRWRRGRGMAGGPAVSRSVAEVGAAFGTAPWLLLALWPVDPPPGTAMTRLLPLTDLATQLSGPPLMAAVQIVGNLMLFAALGAFAPVRSAAFAGPWRVFALGVAASLSLEICQRLFATGRVFSVDDVLLNALGCVLAGLVTRHWWRRRPSAGSGPGAPRRPGRARSGPAGCACGVDTPGTRPRRARRPPSPWPATRR